MPRVRRGGHGIMDGAVRVLLTVVLLFVSFLFYICRRRVPMSKGGAIHGEPGHDKKDKTGNCEG
jgi:hypothetical protein